MDHLVEADLASNQLGWQWLAGSGNDAAPFFRVFNLTLQGTKFDPVGSYIRHYVPELAGVDDRHIHGPHELAGSLLGARLPRPDSRPLQRTRRGARPLQPDARLISLSSAPATPPSALSRHT